MRHQVKLHVWGEFACFTRPEFKTERVSYDVITPSAARGVLEAIHWKPVFSWVVDRIHVLSPIEWTSIKRSEVSGKVPVTNIRRAMAAGNLDGLRQVSDEVRVQRAATVLRRPAYVIEAHPEIRKSMVWNEGGDSLLTKHAEIFRRRASKGQCFYQPCLGTREFAADFDLVDGKEFPESRLRPEEKSRDLGWMLLDLDHQRQPALPKFFRAVMQDGVINTPPMWSIEARS